jgi:hypothetical protein
MAPRLITTAAAVLLLGGTAAGCQSQPTADTSPPTHIRYDPEFLSVGYYPQTVAHRVRPNELNYSAFTTIASFGPHPTPNGELTNVHAQTLRAQVTAAHDAGKKAILTVGGEGDGKQFVAATRPGTRAHFKNVIEHTVTHYGYDGVDIDWEEHVPQHRKQYAALLSELHHSSVGTVSIPVDPGQLPPPLVAKVAHSVNRVDVLSYKSTGAKWIQQYRNAGVPTDKLTLGIGLSPDEHDRTPADVRNKVSFAEQHNLAGVFSWHIGFLHPPNTDPRLKPLRHAVNTN